MHSAIIQSSVSWADNDYWMSWNKQNEEIEWGQEEKPVRRVQELWSIRGLIWHPARLTVKGREFWLPILQKYLKFSLCHQRFQAWWNLYCYLGCGYHLKHMEWWLEGDHWLCWRASQMWCAHYIRSPPSAKHALNTRTSGMTYMLLAPLMTSWKASQRKERRQERNPKGS